ncbi:MAG: hypothetical protein H7Y27_00825, partial [Gemmatimonadaceae bacterium]|nr:hypothetical protein [Chitinophagaceae bacterium]
TSAAVKVSLAIIVVLIFVMGIYPKPVLQLTNDVIDVIVLRMQSITKN